MSRDPIALSTSVGRLGTKHDIQATFPSLLLVFCHAGIWEGMLRLSVPFRDCARTSCPECFQACAQRMVLWS